MSSANSPYGTGHTVSTSSTCPKLLPIPAQKLHEPSRVAMRRPSSETLTKTAKGVSLPVGISGVGAGAWFVFAHQGHSPNQIMAGAVVAVVGIVCASASKIIAARGQAEVARGQAEVARAQAEAIRSQASSDSEAKILRAQTNAALRRIGLDESRTNQVDRMLINQLIEPDLPKDRRLNDKALVELAKEAMKRSIEAAKLSGPSNSSDDTAPTGGELPTAANGDSPVGPGGVVRNIRAEDPHTTMDGGGPQV
jgi:hypothetical protein